MRPVRLIIAWSWITILPMAAAGAFDAFDPYGTPDPGSYQQGSAGASGYTGYAGADSGPSDRPQPDSDWYSSDWYRDQFGGGRQDEWWAADRWNQPPAPPPSAPTPAWPADAPGPMERGPDWGLNGDSDFGAGDYDPYRRPAAPSPASPDLYGGGYEDGGGYAIDGRENWFEDQGRQVPTPRYRFRGDPKLENSAAGGGNSGYRFRPLTPSEVERQRRASTGRSYVRPRPEPQPDARGQGGEVFGYQPEDAPESFYQRYYRGGP